MSKIHWLKRYKDDVPYEFCPMYEDEVLVYKKLPEKDIVFDKNTDNKTLKKYNFFRVKSDPIPNFLNQTLDGAKSTKPFLSDCKPIITKVEERTLQITYNVKYLSKKDITELKMEEAEMTKTFIIERDHIEFMNSSFNWKQRNIVHWMTLRDTMTEETSPVLDENGDFVEMTKDGLSELIKLASERRTRLERCVAKAIEYGKTRTLMKYFQMNIDSKIKEIWNTE